MRRLRSHSSSRICAAARAACASPSQQQPQFTAARHVHSTVQHTSPWSRPFPLSRPPSSLLPRLDFLSTWRVMSSAASEAEGGGEMQRSIVRKLTDAFTPAHLQVINESYQHNVPSGSETHFKVVVVSQQFSGQSLIARHRSVNAALSEEFKRGLHALSISAKTPQQWEESGGAVSKSPACLGGMKGEAASGSSRAAAAGCG